MEKFNAFQMFIITNFTSNTKISFQNSLLISSSTSPITFSSSILCGIDLSLGSTRRVRPKAPVSLPRTLSICCSNVVCACSNIKSTCPGANRGFEQSVMQRKFYNK